MRESIKKKAMRCIDEVSAEASSTALHLPLDDFLDEAARRIAKAAPLHALGRGKDFSKRSEIIDYGNGTGKVILPNDFQRLLSFRLKGWERPVINAIHSEDAVYAKQSNPVLRGGCAKPVAVLCDGETALEYYSIPQGEKPEIIEARYFGSFAVDNDYPAKLLDITAWELAALVFSTLYDQTGASIAQNKVNELMQLL